MMEEQPVINCRDLYEDTLYKKLERKYMLLPFLAFDKDYTITLVNSFYCFR